MTKTGNKIFFGKVAFITGAGSGIGKATALAFAREGASVVIGYVTKEHADRTASLVKEMGAQALIVKCDVSKDDEVKNAINQTIKTFGRLDCAFNNAGVGQFRSDTAEISLKEWDRVIGVDLRGTFSCMRHEIPQMLKQGGGVIVNHSSVCGVVGHRLEAAYHAAKHGVLGLTKVAAIEYATRGIRINAICPGIINTPMNQQRVGEGNSTDPEALRPIFQGNTPIDRAGSPEEVAAVVLWLCGPSASYVVGHPLLIDGGYTISK